MINVEEHLGLAMTIALKYYKRSKDKYTYDEIKSTAFLGLIEATKRFDETKGFKFPTYAIPFIEGRIKREFRDDKWYFVKRNVPQKMLSLNFVIDDTNNIEMQETLIGEGNVEENLINSALVSELFKLLTPREKQVIYLYYYMDLSQSEISKNTGMSQPNVSRIIKKSLKKMRKELYKDKVLSA